MILQFPRARLYLTLTIAIYLIGSCVIALADEISNAQLQPISITYTVNLVSEKYGNATLGKALITIRKTKKGYIATSATKAQGLAAILEGNTQEECEFVVKNGKTVSTGYKGGRKQLNDYQASFDWQNRKIDFSDGQSMDMPNGYVVDTCSFPFAAALMKGDGPSKETIYVVEGKKKRIRGYKFKSAENEKLDTKFGEIDTLKVVLERELKPERTTTFWLSPKHSHIPLKMEEKRRTRTTTLMVDLISN